MIKKRYSLAVAAIALALMMAGCAPSSSPTEGSGSDFPEGTTMAKLSDAGKITIGTKFDQPLWGLQGPDGVPVGFDIEVAKIVADELGIATDDIEWVEMSAANREPFLQSGKVDLVIATYTINDKRKEIVDFAGPYFMAGQSLLVLKDNTDITGPDSIAGKIICSAEGSTPIQNIRDNYPEAETTTAGVMSDCLEPLRNGQVDAVTTDNASLAGISLQNPGEFKLAGAPFTDEPYGIGVTRGDDDFRAFLNDTIEKAQADGRWKQAWDKTAGEGLEYTDPPALDRY